MLTQTIMWTALPNGIVGPATDRRLRLSVYVSPRLRTDQDGTLALFPDFIDWPAHLQPGNVAFAVQVVDPRNPNNPSNPLPATITSQPPDSTLWQALFPSSSFVRSYAFTDLTRPPVSSYPVASHFRQLKAGYQAMLKSSPVALPGSDHRRQAFPSLYDALHGPLAPSIPPAMLAATTAQEAELLGSHSAQAENLLRGSDGSTLSERVAAVVDTAKQLAQLRSPGTFTPLLPNTGSPVSHWNQFIAFHNRPPLPAQPVMAANIDVHRLDFHQALAALSEYPDLLRLLGLVIDLELPEAGVSGSPLPSPDSQPLAIQVIPTCTPPLGGNPPYTPRTAYILQGDRFFVPAPVDATQPESVYGLLNLQLSGPDPNASSPNPPLIRLYDLIQVDVVGTAFKALSMASAEAGGSSDAGIPAMRTSGVSLTRAGQASVLHSRFSSAFSNNTQLESTPDKPVTLFAEDILRGYRVDVHDAQSARWYSLHQRTGSYTFKAYPGGPHAIPTSGEGMAQPALTRSTQQDGGHDPSSPLYIHESLFHWQGWSLSVPRPGKTISDEGLPETVTSEALPDGFQLNVAFDVLAGTLPRLRYGRNYQLRARTVDLAGNSLSLQEADALLQLLPTLGRPQPVLPTGPGDFTYRRYEPVAAPVVVLREKVTEGESLLRLVIRSNYNESAAACAQRLTALVAQARPTDRVTYTAANERHLVPPKIALAMAEMLGLLDASFGTQAPSAVVQRIYNLARKEKGRLSDTAILDTATGQAVPIPATTGIDPLTGQTLTRPSVELVATGTSNNEANGYYLHHEPQLHLPYLPDLLSRGAALFGLPGLAKGQAALLAQNGTLTIGPSLLPQATVEVVTSNTQIDFGSDWPERLPFRLQLAEPGDSPGPSTPPTWDPQARVLTAHLAKGEQVTVRLASFLSEGDLDLLGIWSWLVEQLKAEGQPVDANTLQTALAGAIWMLTPFHQLTLVHAVQQPLVEPQLQAVFTPREPGATFAYFQATAPIHGKSTAKLDVLASWTEQVDSDETGPHTLSAQAHVFDVPVPQPDEAPAQANPAQMNPVPVAVYDSAHDVVNFLVPPASPAGEVLPHTANVFLSRHEFGDTKHRKVRYQAVATTRFREYFPQELINDPAQLTRSGAAVEIDVPSTARPAAPRVLYAVPIFSWNRPPAVPGQPRTITRRSTGVRVYLERPWFSSGDGELLGVVLASLASYPPSERLRPLVSHWGNDPIWETDLVPAAPQPSHFPRAQVVGNNLTLDELVLPDGTWGDNERVQVAGHAVAYDEEHTKLWYSDIQVDVGTAYSPFVRLALARYQPHALPNMELSRVMLGDFVQILPDRTVTITPAAHDANVYTIQVDGLTYRSNSWVPYNAPDFTGATRVSPSNIDELVPIPTLIELAVEQRIAGTSDEAGWQEIDASQPVHIQVTSAAEAGQPLSPGAPLWKGDVSLPSNRVPGQFRIVMRELEHMRDDTQFKRRFTVEYPPDPDIPHDKGSKIPVDVTFFPGVGRLVFAETIEL